MKYLVERMEGLARQEIRLAKRGKELKNNQKEERAFIIMVLSSNNEGLIKLANDYVESEDFISTVKRLSEKNNIEMF